MSVMAVACASDSLGSNPSCSAFNSASSSERSKAVEGMQQSHGDSSSTKLAVLSVTAYCALNSSGSITGVYSG